MYEVVGEEEALHPLIRSHVRFSAPLRHPRSLQRDVRRKRAGRVGGTFVETSWGRDGHTGPVYPRGTRICVQFKGLSTKAAAGLPGAARLLDQPPGYGRGEGLEPPERTAASIRRAERTPGSWSSEADRCRKLHRDSLDRRSLIAE
nr:hypothetical protein C5F59_39285 [Streptomyces sp. QL37]